MKQPPKWKFAVMVWIAIYPAITLVSFLLGDKIQNLPIAIRTLIMTLILVPIMVFILLPLFAKIMNNWLHK